MLLREECFSSLNVSRGQLKYKATERILSTGNLQQKGLMSEPGCSLMARGVHSWTENMQADAQGGSGWLFLDKE